MTVRVAAAGVAAAVEAYILQSESVNASKQQNMLFSENAL